MGRTEVTAQQLALDEVPEFAQAERRLQTATVSSLRLDAVLAAMLRCSRGMAAELVAAGRVEINHLPFPAPMRRYTNLTCSQCGAKGASASQPCRARAKKTDRSSSSSNIEKDDWIKWRRSLC